VGKCLVHLVHALLPVDLRLLARKVRPRIETCHQLEAGGPDGSGLTFGLLRKLDQSEQAVEIVVQSLGTIRLSFRFEEDIFIAWATAVSLLLVAPLNVCFI
jgi:hypothetical protein